MEGMVNTRISMRFIIFLITTFCCYNWVIYTQKNPNYTPILSQKALKGQSLWQENNCFSCHQLYGLGGYLGPDLTNVFSSKGKGPSYIKAFLNSGIKAMPQFSFSENDKEALVAFLKEVDQTGYYPNYQAKIKPNGWVAIQYKHEK
jgi:nitric oxide reductase subunit C